MSTDMNFVLSFYVPLFISFLLLFSIFFTSIIQPKRSYIKIESGISFFKFTIPYNIILKRRPLFKLIFSVIPISIVIITLSQNFSSFYPDRLKMDVYFDTRGIERELKGYTSIELKDFNIPNNWKDYLLEYDQAITGKFRASLERGADPNFDPNTIRSQITASGETTFKLRKIKLLQYRIIDSNGQLNYQIDTPKMQRRTLIGSFELSPSPSNTLNLSIVNLFSWVPIVLGPKYFQRFSATTGSSAPPFDHSIISITKTRILPLPGYSNTIYLWEHNGGYSIPVAYCMYHTEP